MTAQHSGTRFLESYFLHLGFSPRLHTQRCRQCGEAHGYEKHTGEHNNSGKFEYWWSHYTRETSNTHKFADAGKVPPQYPIVSTLRHPHKTAISFLMRGYDLRRCLRMWDSYIELSTQRPIIHYNLECKKENRTPQLLNLVKQIDCYDEHTEELTDEFVLDWKPIGAYNSEYKTDYLLDGTLPDVFDWSRFDRAVNWYEKRIGECEY